MKIQNRPPTLSMAAVPKALNQSEVAPPRQPVYNHLPQDRVELRHPVAAAVTAVGAGVLTGLTLGQINPWVGLAAGLAAAGAGYYVGANHDRLGYSIQAKRRELDNQTSQILAEARKGPQAPFKPLGENQRIQSRATGQTARSYDGFDSSRDIAALYAAEGRPEEAYAIEVEVAHLRPAAEVGHLDSELEIRWEGGERSWTIDRDQQESGLQAHHNPLFQRLQLRLDKQELRLAGWQDGQPLSIRVATRGESPEISGSEIAGQTDRPAPANSIFRWEGKTIYYAVTDRFANGDPSNDNNCQPQDPQKFHGGDWQGVIDQLDYLKGLNVDCIWLSCPYEGQRDFVGLDGFHGYWPMDFHKTESSFGDRAKLKELTRKAHEKGMKVMLDVVLNHTGYGHPFTIDPAKKDWFHANGNIAGLGQWEMENGALCGLPDLAQENPEVSHYLIDVHQDWLEDADAFRLDALRHMPESFLRQFNQAMHQKKPDFYSVGEAFWLDSNFIAGYQNRTTDSMFDFPLAYAIRRTFAGDPSRDLKERIRLWKEVKPHASEHEAWRVLLDSHKSQDMSLLSKVFADDNLYDNPRKLGTFIDNHDMVRFMSDTAGDIRRQEQALAFLYGVRGTPHVYYGTEVAMEGIGPANRNDMEWGKNPQLTESFRQLSQARSSSEALQYGSQVELHCGQDTYAFSRVRTEEEVICLFNKSEQPQTLRFPLHSESPIPEGASLKDMLGDQPARVVDGHLEVELPAKGYRYLQWRAA